MSQAIKRLYESMILEHNKNPRNFSEITPCSHHSHGKNPLCGDDYFVYIMVEDNRIKNISFKGEGCAISKASGSLMTEFLTGKTVEEVIAVKNNFLSFISSDTCEKTKTTLGKLKVFEGVKQFPVRVKCAALVWRTLEDALESQCGTISTE